MFAIIVHLSIILSVMALLIRIWFSTENFLHFYDGYDDKLRSDSLKVIILLNSLTAILAIDSTYRFKDMRNETNRQLCDQNFINYEEIGQNVMKKQPHILRIFKAILDCSYIDQFNSKSVLISLFISIPVFFYTAFIISFARIALNFSENSIENIFFAINFIINIFSTLHYITVCLLIQMKFIALNGFIEESEKSFDKLQEIRKW